jgi:hypothetical protein
LREALAVARRRDAIDLKLAAFEKRLTESRGSRQLPALVGDDIDNERAIRWLIALMVLCCDPLAIALTAAASARRSEARGDEQSEVETVRSIR